MSEFIQVHQVKDNAILLINVAHIIGVHATGDTSSLHLTNGDILHITESTSQVYYLTEVAEIKPTHICRECQAKIYHLSQYADRQYNDLPF